MISLACLSGSRVLGRLVLGVLVCVCVVCLLCREEGALFSFFFFVPFFS